MTLRSVAVTVAGTINLLGVLSCADETTRPVPDRLYPAIVERVPPDSLASLTRIFSLMNPGMCFRIDEFGLTGAAPPCLLAGVGIGADPDTARLLKLAQETLERSAAFTGVTHKDALLLKGFVSRSFTNPAHSYYHLTFQPQEYDGLPVENTFLSVNMDTVAVLRIYGHHYRSIHVPLASVSEDEAWHNLVGREIRWFDIASQEHIFTVTSQFFLPPARQVVLPVVTVNGLELRVAWRCPVAFDSGPNPGWAAFVDTVTGEVLEIRQLFVT